MRPQRAKALIGFAGFGGPEIALREAGIETLSIELDPAIADVNRQNGGNVITANILDIDPADYIGWWLCHFSPPCPSFSLANQTSSETELDLALARKIAEFIIIGQPEYFTLENVYLYRKSQSWAIILEALQGMGYGVDWWHLNAADYGVPQSRRRMIVIARWDGQKPIKPWPTHSKNGDMFTKPWRGWYDAIEDLIPGLPETQFADWQMKAMPEKFRTWLVGHSSVILGLAEVDEPAYTVTTNSSKARAFIVNSRNTTRDLSIRYKNDPAVTVTASDFRAIPKAFVVDCQNNGPSDGRRGLTIRQQDQPIFTMTASAERTPLRAGFPSGRIVSMTPRALARFQDFPDSFQLPYNRALACRGIGNALPPGMYRAILKSLNLATK